VLPFVLLTLLFIALPALLLVILGQRAQKILPKVRAWMNDNSWIISRRHHREQPGRLSAFTGPIFLRSRGVGSRSPFGSSDCPRRPTDAKEAARAS
jgi:hypothetical protein